MLRFTHTSFYRFWALPAHKPTADSLNSNHILILPPLLSYFILPAISFTPSSFTSLSIKFSTLGLAYGDICLIVHSSS